MINTLYIIKRFWYHTVQHHSMYRWDIRGLKYIIMYALNGIHYLIALYACEIRKPLHNFPKSDNRSSSFFFFRDADREQEIFPTYKKLL